MPRLAAASDSSTRILDVAERLVQTRGFNAFSYADIAAVLHVTKASLHYHFSTKADLGTQLIERYRTAFMAALDRIGETCRDADAKLNAYVQIYVDVLKDDRMCLCAILAAEYATLPAAMQEGVRRFFDTNEAWLAELLMAGRANGQLHFTGAPVEVARVFVAALEGAMLMARARLDLSQLQSIAGRLLADLGVGVGLAAQ